MQEIVMFYPRIGSQSHEVDAQIRHFFESQKLEQNQYHLYTEKGLYTELKKQSGSCANRLQALSLKLIVSAVKNYFQWSAP